MDGEARDTWSTQWYESHSWWFAVLASEATWPSVPQSHSLPKGWLVHAVPRTGPREETYVGQVWHHPGEVVTGPQGADGMGVPLVQGGDFLSHMTDWWTPKECHT